MNASIPDTPPMHARLREVFRQARLPVMAASMFLVSVPELVTASVRAGIVGT